MTPEQNEFRYTGQTGSLFSLAIWTAFLTLVTLGIYRFWSKTRIRRYIWSHTSLGGEPFEYTGTGLEKLLGFLLAVVFLAVYLGVIQMLLFYFGFVLFVEPTTQAEALGQIAAVYLSLFALAPLVLFAIYRARRYKMARTRWRGIRFGMEKGAWGYVWRALGHWLLTILTLGLMLPRQTFRLEKYMADRSWFGDARVTQGGSWTGLYPAMKHLLIGVAIIIGGAILGSLTESAVLFFVALPVGWVWFMIGVISYRVQSFGYLTSHKTVEGGIGFVCRPRTGEIIRIYIVGGIAISILASLGFGIAGAIFAGAMQSVMTGNEPPVLLGLLVAISYLATLLATGALYLALITQPALAHYLQSTEVTNLAAADTIRQRAFDAGADAEGFADALDIGGAI